MGGVIFGGKTSYNIPAKHNVWTSLTQIVNKPDQILRAMAALHTF